MSIIRASKPSKNKQVIKFNKSYDSIQSEYNRMAVNALFVIIRINQVFQLSKCNSFN